MRSPLRPDLHTRGDRVDEGASPLAPIWGGILDEFRNHLQRLAAGTDQVRDRLPDLVASDLAPGLAEMEASIENLTVLASWISAMTQPGERVISDLHDVIERALAMARPWLRADVRISVGSQVGAVRNRRGAAECALAAVIVTLARAPGDLPRELGIEVFSGRGTLVIEIESNPGPRSSESSSSPSSASPPWATSWRGLLAERLAALVGGTLEPLADRVGIGLRFQ
jgi:hypothetical protein